MTGEPLTGQAGNSAQCAWFLEKVGRTRHDGQPIRAAQLLLRLLVEAQYDLVAAADDEQGGGLHVGEPRLSQVRTAAARDNRVDVRAGFGGGPESRGGSGARAEVPERRMQPAGLVAKPAT